MLLGVKMAENTQEKGLEFIRSIQESAANPQREVALRWMYKAVHEISAEEMTREFTV